MREKLAGFFYWLDYKSPPLVNIILTAGFHTALTFVAGRYGLSGEVMCGYIMKEGGPLGVAAFTGTVREKYKTFKPTPEQKKLGWKERWVLADSIADVAGPVLVHLFYVF